MFLASEASVNTFQRVAAVYKILWPQTIKLEINIKRIFRKAPHIWELVNVSN